MTAFNLKSLSDVELLAQTEKTVLQERECTNLVLDHLREVEKRRLYAKLGFSSMFQYCTKHLKYCNASAQLRIDAMRLSQEVPSIKASLENGALNLSTIGSFQKFVRHEKSQKKNYTTQAKKEFIKQIENKSKEEAEKLFSAISPGMIPKEKKRVISPTETEIKFIANDELLKLMDQMKCKLIQKGNLNPSIAGIIEAALKKALKVSGGKVESKTTSPGEVTSLSSSTVKVGQKPAATSPREVDSQTKIPTVKVAQKLKATSPEEVKTVQNAPSKIAAKEGSKSLESTSHGEATTHNITQAIAEFGISKIEPYLKL